MFDKVVDKLNQDTFKNIFYLFIISCFWTVSFYLFKPTLLQENYHILFSLLFCFSLIWALLSTVTLFLVEVLIIKTITNNNHKLISKLRVEIYLVLSLIGKSILIYFGYYYSMCFTEYLRFIFKWVSIIFTVFFILYVLVAIFNVSQKKNTSSH